MFPNREQPDACARRGAFGQCISLIEMTLSDLPGWEVLGDGANRLSVSNGGRARKSAKWMSLSFWPISTYRSMLQSRTQPSSSSVAHSLNTPFPSASRSSSIDHLLSHCAPDECLQTLCCHPSSIRRCHTTHCNCESPLVPGL